jgi:hypothetical protein
MASYVHALSYNAGKQVYVLTPRSFRDHAKISNGINFYTLLRYT